MTCVLILLLKVGNIDRNNSTIRNSCEGGNKSARGNKWEAMKASHNNLLLRDLRPAVDWTVEKNSDLGDDAPRKNRVSWSSDAPEGKGHDLAENAIFSPVELTPVGELWWETLREAREIVA